MLPIWPLAFVQEKTIGCLRDWLFIRPSVSNKYNLVTVEMNGIQYPIKFQGFVPTNMYIIIMVEHGDIRSVNPNQLILPLFELKSFNPSISSSSQEHIEKCNCVTTPSWLYLNYIWFKIWLLIIILFEYCTICHVKPYNHENFTKYQSTFQHQLWIEFVVV